MGASISSVSDSCDKSAVSSSDLCETLYKSAVTSSDLCETLSGSRDGVNSPLPSLLEERMEWDVRVEDLKIYMERLAPNKGLTHQFLVVTVRYMKRGTMKSRAIGHIKAEKSTDRDSGRGFIRLSVEDLDEAGLVQKRVCPIQDDCGMIPMRTLVDILRAHHAAYDVLTNNCWKYAEETYRRLITELSELPNTTSEAKQRLQSHLAELGPVRVVGDALNRRFHAWHIGIHASAEIGIVVGGILSIGVAVFISASAVPAPLPIPRALSPQIIAFSQALQIAGPATGVSVSSSDLVRAMEVLARATQTVQILYRVPPSFLARLMTSVGAVFTSPYVWIPLAVVGASFVLVGLGFMVYKACRAIRENWFPEQVNASL